MVSKFFRSMGFHGRSAVVSSPLAGRVIPLSKVKDEAFFDGSLGEGVAIVPTGNRVVAPADAKIEAIFPTGHAVALRTATGVDMLIHIGIDTVNLEGRHFRVLASPGDVVWRGDVLIEFDREGIIADGYDITVPVVVRNSVEFSEVKSCGDVFVDELGDLLEIRER